MAVVGIDYCFPALTGHDPLTILTVAEIYSGAAETVMVDAKGVADFPVKRGAQAWRLEAFSEQASSPTKSQPHLPWPRR